MLIEIGGVKYEVGWSIKIPYTKYFIIWVKGICVIEIVYKNKNDEYIRNE